MNAPGREGAALVRVLRRLAGVAASIAVSAACSIGSGPTPEATPESASESGAGGDTRWQYQLQGAVDTSVPAKTFVIDLFDTPESVVEELKAGGRTVICYVNVGASEDWRADSAALPAEVRGTELADWPGEFWYDVRRTDLLEPFLASRFDLCREKGFDGVEADNVDGWTNDSGFDLTAEDQLAYNRLVARLAHERSLTIGLKNDLDQVADLEPDFDFAVNEQCAQYDECGKLEPFVRAGKPVLHVEYGLGTGAFCTETTGMGFESIRKPRDLTVPREPCP